MGYKQGFKTSFKFTDHSGVTFLDNGWNAGVDQGEIESEIKMKLKMMKMKMNQTWIMYNVYDEALQEISETLHEPRDANPIIPDTINDEREEIVVNMIEDIDTREPEQAQSDKTRTEVKNTRHSKHMQNQWNG